MSNEVGLEMTFGGEKYLATRKNTLLFTFVGKLAMYDHVFMIPEQGERHVLGGYLFSDHPVYERVVDFIKKYNLTQHLNLSEISKGDKDAFHASHPNGLEPRLPKPEYQDVEDLYFNDSFPESWDDEA